MLTTLFQHGPLLFTIYFALWLLTNRSEPPVFFFFTSVFTTRSFNLSCSCFRVMNAAEVWKA